jgi:hypothetical protein
LFSNLNIETTREAAKTTATETSKTAAVAAAANDPNAVKPEVVSFTVKAKFEIAKKDSQPAPAPTQQVAMKK